MGSKMESKLRSNPRKFELQGWFGAPGRPSWRQDGPRCDLGRVWGSTWRSVGAHLGAKMGQVAAKMALSCPTWRQDGPKMAIDFKMTNLRPFWEASCLLFGILGVKSQIAKNIFKKIGFNGFWGSWGCSWRPCWLILARCWAMLGQLGAILEQLGDKMRPKSAKMTQDGAQERQDEAR